MLNVRHTGNWKILGCQVNISRILLGPYFHQIKKLISFRFHVSKDDIKFWIYTLGFPIQDTKRRSFVVHRMNQCSIVSILSKFWFTLDSSTNLILWLWLSCQIFYKLSYKAYPYHNKLSKKVILLQS